MITETIMVSGQIEIYFNESLVETHNLVVSAGKTWIAKRMIGQDSVMSHIATGTSNTGEQLTDTALGNQLAIKEMDPIGGASASNIVTYNVTFGQGESVGIVAEVGIFNAASEGTMLSRAVVGPYTKGPNDVITLVWSITIN